MTCSLERDEAKDPLAASAPHTRVWFAIEDPRPWGEKPVKPVEWSEHGITTVLIRRPNERPSLYRAYLAFVRPGEQRIFKTEVADQHVFASLDPEAIVNGEIPSLFTLSDEKPTLVCTNGKRDQCCAVRGRAYLDQMLAAGENVWESTHIGGHRFAPVVLSLPDGAVRAGNVLRGLSGLTRPEQAAHIAVRDEVGDHVAVSTAEIDDKHWMITVYGNGSRFAVTVSKHDREPVVESCGKLAVPGDLYRVDSVTTL